MDCTFECNDHGGNGGGDHAHIETNHTLNGPHCNGTTLTWLGKNVEFLDIVGLSFWKQNKTNQWGQMMEEILTIEDKCPYHHLLAYEKA